MLKTVHIFQKHCETRPTKISIPKSNAHDMSFQNHFLRISRPPNIQKMCVCVRIANVGSRYPHVRLLLTTFQAYHHQLLAFAKLTWQKPAESTDIVGWIHSGCHEEAFQTQAFNEVPVLVQQGAPRRKRWEKLEHPWLVKRNDTSKSWEIQDFPAKHV